MVRRVNLLLLLLGLMISGGMLRGSEPQRLQPDGADRLAGLVHLDDREIALQLVDRDGNGVFDDPEDRLFLDLDSDGQFHPLRERFAVSPTLRLRGHGGTDRYAFSLHSDPWRVALVPIHGTGTVRVHLSTPGSGEASPSGQWVKVSATLASRSGLHRQLDRLDEAVEVPVGEYCVEELQLEYQGDRHWAITFRNLQKNRDYPIQVQADTESAVELLGDLTLSARIIGAAPASGKLSIQPSLMSGTGLTLTRSRVGEQSAAADNLLIASLLAIGAKPRPSDESPAPLDLKSSGFACGQFCPINLSSRQPIVPGMLISLSFDAGPLGGPMHAVVTPQLPGLAATAELADTFDSSR